MFRLLVLVQFSFVIYGLPRVTREERGLPHVPRDERGILYYINLLNPLDTIGFFLLVLYYKLGMVH